MGYMIKDTYCCCCGRKIAFDEKDYKIKAKILYQDPDPSEGIWAGYRNEHLCYNCMNKIREMIAKEQKMES